MYVDNISSALSGMIARIAATGAIFKKVLELNLTTIGKVSIGKIVNLAGYDVQRLDKVCRLSMESSVCTCRVLFFFCEPEELYPMFQLALYRVSHSPYTSF